MKILTLPTGTPSTATWTRQAQQVTIQDRTNANFPRNIVLSTDGVRVMRSGTQAGIPIHDLIVAMVGQEPALTWPPVITSQPVSAACVHSSTAATFSVTATKETDIALTYAWQYNKKAVGTLTYDNVSGPTDGQTITVGGVVYTFKTALTPTAGEVLINGGGDASLLNLIRAINHSGTAGTDYANLGATAVANPQVTAATSVTAHAFLVTAITAGTDGNSIATTSTTTHFTWGATTLLTGGWTACSGTINGCAYTNNTTATLTCTPTTTGQTGFSHRCLLTTAGGSTDNQTATDTVVLTIT